MMKYFEKKVAAANIMKYKVITDTDRESIRDYKPPPNLMILKLNDPNCVILGVRKGCLGEGYYAPPGGHMEYG